MIAMRQRGKSLRAIAAAVSKGGRSITAPGVAKVLAAHAASPSP
jgi:hypothetical protein